MKRITDLFEEIYDSELEGLDIQKLLCEEEELSREETERIFEKVCQKTEHFRAQKTRKFSKKMAAGLLAAALLLVTITAAAGEYFHITPYFLKYFGASSEQEQEILTNMEAPFSKEKEKFSSVVKQDVSIKVSQLISDGERLYFYLELEIPEEIGKQSQEAVSHGGYLGFQNISYQISGEETNGTVGLILHKSPDKDNKYYTVGKINITDKDYNGKILSLNFENLGYLEPEHTVWNTLVYDSWPLQWTLNYKDAFAEYQIKEELATETGNVMIQSVRVSPLSLRLTGTSDTLDSILNDDQILFSIDGILLSDGSCQDLFEYQYVGEEQEMLTAGGEFKEIVPLETMIGVRIKGSDFYFQKAEAE